MLTLSLPSPHPPVCLQVSMMYRHLLKLPTTSKVQIEPFSFQQTKALMQVGVMF